MQASWLFDDGHSWQSQPLVAFGALIGSAEFVSLGRRELSGRASSDGDSGRLGAASAKVYGAMFSSFVRHLTDRGLGVPQARSSDIASFIESGERTGGVRLRYIRMLERVYEHLRLRGVIERNPVHSVAAMLIVNPQACVPELPTAFVGKGDHASVVESLIRSMRDRGDWRSVRDAAMAAVLLGAGLKVYEMGAMRVSWVTGRFPDFIVEVPQVGVSRVHRVPLSPFASDCLQAWLELRTRLDVVQPLLFIGSLKEGRMLQAATALDKSTVYRRIKAILTAAGVDVPRMGGRTLRNSYAVAALSEGQSPALVEERLGLRESKSMSRYLAAARSDGADLLSPAAPRIRREAP